MVESYAVQANHKILEKLEEAKASVEILLDNLPDCYMLIRSDGRVLKGNYAASHLFNKTTDTVIGENVRSLFTDESWKVFNSKIERVMEINKHLAVVVSKRKVKTPPKDVVFEVLVEQNGKPRFFQWNLSLFIRISPRRGQLIQVFGRDITELIHYKSMLEYFFSSIPLGVVTIDQDGRILQPVSKYLEYLFNVGELKNQNFFELLFPLTDPDTVKVKNSMRANVKSAFGVDKEKFDSIVRAFPTTIAHGSSNKTLDLKYHAISKNSVVSGMLIIIDDKQPYAGD